MPGFNVPLQPLITGIAKEALQATVPALGAFSIGIEMGPKSAGDKARVFLYGTPEDAAAFDESTNNYENSTAADVDYVDVTLTAPEKITKAVTQQQLRNGLQLRILINSMVRKVILGAAAKGVALVTNANFGAPIHSGAATTLTADKMADLAGSAADLGWDPEMMHAVLSTPYYTNLVKDDDIKTTGGAVAEQLMRSGIVPTLAGFTAYRYPGLPGNSENLVGFLTDGSGLCLAFAENQLEMGVAKQLEMYEVITVPNGPIISVRLHGSVAKNKAFLTVESLTGVAKGRAEGLKRITSA